MTTGQEVIAHDGGALKKSFLDRTAWLLWFFDYLTEAMIQG